MTTKPTLALLFALASSCAPFDRVTDTASDLAADALMPVEQENKLGKDMTKEIEKELELHPSDDVQGYVRALGKKVAKAAKDTPAGISFTFKVVDDDEAVNAFAAPGGYIYVYSGLLKRADDEAEVAAVLAHEIAHVTQRHVAKRLIATYGLDTVSKLALGEKPELLGQIASAVVSTGVLLKYGREQESESDAKGLPYCAGAGLDPHGMVSFFEKLKRDEGSPLLVILQSHPLPSERIDDARAVIKRMGDVPKARNEAEYAAFKQKL